MGGRIIGALILEEKIDQDAFLRGYPTEVKVQQLHSTKGWKAPHWERWRSVDAPVRGAFHWASGCGPHRSKSLLQPIINPRALLRHGWYRRKLRKMIAFGIASDEERKQLAAWEEANRANMR